MSQNRCAVCAALVLLVSACQMPPLEPGYQLTCQSTSECPGTTICLSGCCVEAGQQPRCGSGNCVPVCQGKICGPDGCGGSCGSCGGGWSCGADGFCVPPCQPACSGRTCGNDGCGGSCGTCPATSACNALGKCVCVDGATRCVAGSPMEVETCSHGAWSRANCGAYWMCSAGACRPACGLTSTPADPTICFFPNADGVNTGVAYFTSAKTLLSVPNLAEVSASSNSKTAPVGFDANEPWPYYWIVDSGANDYAALRFKLSQFAAGRTVSIAYRVRRANLVAGSASVGIAAWVDGASNFYQTSDAAPAGWTTMAMPFASTAPWNYAGTWNNIAARPAGDSLHIEYVVLTVR